MNEALQEAIKRSGAYVIVTPKPVVGTKADNRIAAMQDGITETGNDPTLLSSIQIYDCNKLAAWANAHPSVALWLNELLREVHLGGFQTFSGWGRCADISEVPFQKDDEKRFLVSGVEILPLQNDGESIPQENSFEQIRKAVSKFLVEQGSSIRVVGPSGYGKTRLVYEIIADHSSTPRDVLGEGQVIYCLFEDVRDRLLNIAREISDSGSRALLIVDDCPDAIHTKLSETVRRNGSCCHLITIGVETKAHGMRRNLIVELKGASNALIDKIAGATNKQVSKKNASLIRDLSQGFPRMAVVASRALEDGDEELSSVETLISRIVWGEHLENASAFESLQLLSLFTIVGMEHEEARELEEIASLCGKTGRQMFAELRRFVDRGVLFRVGDYGEVQPLPLAMRLSNQWLESQPAGALEHLFRSLSEEMKLRMVGRLRWVSWSNKVADFGRALISEALPNEEALDSEFGSKLLDRFVHLVPDATMEHLDRLLSGKSIDDLATFESGRRYTVWALQKLVFRRQTFDAAARLLLKLGAAENEDWENNASGLFVDLFQLHLSGTEASPEEKLVVLDQGLATDDDRVHKLCVRALDRMLQTSHFSRSGGSEHIGAGEALQDWRPRIWGDVFDYHLSALSRLERIALHENNPNSRMALDSIGTHLRGLFAIAPIIDKLQSTIAKLLEIYPHWHRAALAVNEWLFFDSDSAEAAYQGRLRDYYFRLLPTDPLEKIYFYSSGWAGDIHDPDVPYDESNENEHRYAEGKIGELLDALPKRAECFLHLLGLLMEKPTNSGWIAASRVAKHVDDPENLLWFLLDNRSLASEAAILANLARSIISGAAQTERGNGLRCLEVALGAQSLKASTVELISAVGLDDELMLRVIEVIRDDVVEPSQVSAIAFADILENVDDRLTETLVSALLEKQARGAWAAIDFLAHALYRTDPKDGRLLRSIEATVTQSALFAASPYSNMDWYRWCSLVERTLTGSQIDDSFRAQLVDFIISVIFVKEFNIQLAFDDHAQKILRLLTASSPQLVWEKYQEQREKSVGVSDYRLLSLFGGELGDPSKPGVLSDIPPDIYVPWMLEDKANRLPLILDWLRLFDGPKDDRQWNPDFVSFLDVHVESPADLDGLLSRMTTGIWWGSYANKLEAERDQLLQLRELSRNPHIRKWADRTASRMEQQITEERRRDANREASFRA